MTAIESVWQNIKAAAKEHALNAGQLHVRDAEVLVVKFLRDARVSPWPADEVVEFYALELIDMIDRERFTVR